MRCQLVEDDAVHLRFCSSAGVWYGQHTRAARREPLRRQTSLSTSQCVPVSPRRRSPRATAWSATTSAMWSQWPRRSGFDVPGRRRTVLSGQIRTRAALSSLRADDSISSPTPCQSLVLDDLHVLGEPGARIETSGDLGARNCAPSIQTVRAAERWRPRRERRRCRAPSRHGRPFRRRARRFRAASGLPCRDRNVRLPTPAAGRHSRRQAAPPTCSCTLRPRDALRKSATVISVRCLSRSVAYPSQAEAGKERFDLLRRHPGDERVRDAFVLEHRANPSRGSSCPHSSSASPFRTTVQHVTAGVDTPSHVAQQLVDSGTRYSSRDYSTASKDADANGSLRAFGDDARKMPGMRLFLGIHRASAARRLARRRGTREMSAGSPTRPVPAATSSTREPGRSDASRTSACAASVGTTAHACGRRSRRHSRNQRARLWYLWLTLLRPAAISRCCFSARSGMVCCWHACVVRRAGAAIGAPAAARRRHRRRPLSRVRC